MKFAQVLFVILGLVISGCSSDSSSSSDSTGGTDSTATTVSLTGVVVSGTTAGSVAVQSYQTAGFKAVTPQAVNGVLSNAIVVAVDSAGNSTTTTADRAGSFAMDLLSDTAYAIIFIDARTLQVAGSLVQANDTSTAAAVTLSGNANLGSVVVNPTTGLAVSTNDANGTLSGFEVTSAAALDADGDGKITQTEISAAQVASVASGSSSIKKLSVADFFEQPGMWSSGLEQFDDGQGGLESNYNLQVTSSFRVQGPSGQIVDARKSSYATYYSSYSSSMGSSAGYPVFNPTSSYIGYDSPTFVNFPTVYDPFDGIRDWGGAAYFDAANDSVWDNYNLASASTSWSKALPLNLPLNTPVQNNYVDSIGSRVETLTITIAQENGANYVLTDTAGTKHIVVKVRSDYTWTPDPVACPNCHGDSGTFEFYVLGGVGASAEAVDASGNPVTPSAAFSNITFGTITSDTAGKFVSATNLNPLLATTPKLTDVERDNVLAYLWNHREQIGTFDWSAYDPATSTAIPDYAYPTYDAYGSAVSPSSWNPDTYVLFNLTAGATQAFTTNLDYSLANGGTANLEFRIWDSTSTTGMSIVVGTAGPDVAIPAGTGTVSVASTLTIPTFTQISAIDPNAVFSWFDVVSGTDIQNAWIDLWVVVKDINGTVVTEQSLDGYGIE